MNRFTKGIGSVLLASGMLLGIAAPAQAWGIDRNNCYVNSYTIQSRSPAPYFYVKPGERYHVINYRKCLSVPTWFNQRFYGHRPFYTTVERWKYNPQTNRIYDWYWGG